MTPDDRFDFAVLGSGYSSLLTVLFLKRLGYDCILLQKGNVPQTVIEESSSPIADLLLGDFCRRHGFAKLQPLSNYQGWVAAYPELQRGEHRGFGFYRHAPEATTIEPADRLAASLVPDDEPSSTHWSRPHVENFLMEQVAAVGIEVLSCDELEMQRGETAWSVAIEGAQSRKLKVRFVIDGTDEGRLMARRLRLADAGERLTCHTRALYGHFRDVQPWHELIHDPPPGSHDGDSIYHLLSEGWMWQRRFDDGVTSVGLVLDAQKHPLRPSKSAEQEWRDLLARQPLLGRQFEHARSVSDEHLLRRSGRLQRMTARMVGDGWALLPTTAGYVGPWSGLAITQSIAGILRLVGALHDHLDRTTLRDELADYEAQMQAELTIMDQWSRLCFVTRRDADLFEAVTLPFFRLLERQRSQLQTDAGDDHGQQSPPLRLKKGLLEAESTLVSEALEKLSQKFKTLGPLAKLTEAAKAEYVELARRTFASLQIVD